MDFRLHQIEVSTVNSPTILVRIIQTIKRRRVSILSLFAAVDNTSDEEGKIIIQLETDDEKLRLLKTQFEKLVDVIRVN